MKQTVLTGENGKSVMLELRGLAPDWDEGDAGIFLGVSIKNGAFFGAVSMENTVYNLTAFVSEIEEVYQKLQGTSKTGKYRLLQI